MDNQKNTQNTQNTKNTKNTKNTPLQKPNKNLTVDRLNILLCLIVVFIHSFGGAVSRMNQNTAVYIASYSVLRCCAFVVQGFFFLSALKFAIGYKNRAFNYVQFLKKRFSKILIPYIFTVVIYYICFYFMHYFNKFSIFDMLKYMVNGRISAPFYFVIALIGFYLLMPFWIFAVKKINKYVLFGSSVIVFAVWNKFFAPYIDFNDVIFVSYVPYWCLGLALGANYKKFLNFMSKKYVLPVSAVLFFIMCYFDGYFFYIMLNAGKTGFYNHMIHLVFCISAIMFLWSVFTKFEHKPLNNLSGAINSQSYNIYLIHCLLLAFFDFFFNILSVHFTAFSAIRISVYATLRVFGTYAVICLLALGVTKIKIRN